MKSQTWNFFLEQKKYKNMSFREPYKLIQDLSIVPPAQSGSELICEGRTVEQLLSGVLTCQLTVMFSLQCSVLTTWTSWTWLAMIICLEEILVPTARGHMADKGNPLSILSWATNLMSESVSFFRCMLCAMCAAVSAHTLYCMLCRTVIKCFTRLVTTELKTLSYPAKREEWSGDKWIMANPSDLRKLSRLVKNGHNIPPLRFFFSFFLLTVLILEWQFKKYF